MLPRHITEEIGEIYEVGNDWGSRSLACAEDSHIVTVADWGSSPISGLTAAPWWGRPGKDQIAGSQPPPWRSEMKFYLPALAQSRSQPLYTF